MSKRKMLWLVGRTLGLIGLAWASAHTTPAVDACYKSATITMDPEGNCISATCNEGTPGMTQCSVAGCVPVFGGSSC